MHSIRDRVRAVQARQQRQWSWYCLSWGLVAGGIAGCLAASLTWNGEAVVRWSWILGAMLPGPMVGLLFAALRPRAARHAAVAIDRTCGLKDRIATAIRFMAQETPPSPVRELQLADAADHLTGVDPKVVAPIRAPRPWLWGVGLTAAALLIGFISSPNEPLQAAVVSNDVVLAQAARVTDGLEELKEFNQQETDPEVEKLLRELAEKLEELKQPGVDPKEALAKLSEMEATLQQHQQQLADPSAETQLQAVGAALSLAEPLQAAGQAMSQGQMEQAAEELAKLEMPELDRQTERAVTEKLKEAQQNSGDGPRKQMKEAIGQVAQGLSQGDRSKFKDGVEGLAGECKKQGRRKKLSDLLRKQCQCLSECKGECESECKNTGLSKKKGGKNWGLGASGNEPGEKTAKLKTSPQMNITGQESDQGDADIETTTSPEQEQQAVRQYRQQAEKYEQLSESVLDSEPIPLGHRQTIRRYFEMIRPQANEVDAVLKPDRTPDE
jgi:hypothetical protein